jgi:hypothetical protein
MEWGITMKKCEAAKLDKNVPYACVAKNSVRAMPVTAQVDTKAILTSLTDAQVHVQYFPVVFLCKGPFIFRRRTHAYFLLEDKINNLSITNWSFICNLYINIIHMGHAKTTNPRDCNKKGICGHKKS